MVPMRNSSDGYPFFFTATKYVRNGHRGLNLSWSVWKGPNGMGQPKYVRHGHRGLKPVLVHLEGAERYGATQYIRYRTGYRISFRSCTAKFTGTNELTTCSEFPCVAREQIVVVWVVNDFQ